MKGLPEIRFSDEAIPSDTIEAAARDWIAENCYPRSEDPALLAYARTLATMAYLDQLLELGKI
jgi:hypothetical protein